MSFKPLFALLLPALAMAAPAAAQIRVDINGGISAPMPIAIPDFAGAAPGTAAFGAAWRVIALREPDAFAEAQHAFIERTHYRPAVAAVRQRTSLDLDARHPAVRDAAWSVAVQHGGAATILAAGVVRADAGCARGEAAYDRALVQAIYAERSAYVLRVAARAGLDSAQGRVLQSIVRSRYPAELAAALAMFAGPVAA